MCIRDRLNTDSGVINQIIYSLTGNKLEFLSDPKYFRWIIVIQNIWKETGWGMIIFLAALAGVDTQLYEAAQVDGAGKLRQVWHEMCIRDRTETIEYKLTGEDRYCPDCGTKYKVVTKEVVKRLKFIPSTFEVVEEVTYVYSLSLIHI